MKHERPLMCGTSTVETAAITQSLLRVTGMEPRAWLAAEAQMHSFEWLLAYTARGVIWGRYDGSSLALSCDGDDALALDWERLQQCRLFGPEGELSVWRGVRDAWQASLTTDSAGVVAEGWWQPPPAGEGYWFDEPYLLWGTRANHAVGAYFREVEEGSRGIGHAPPITAAPAPYTRAHLVVRHYLAQEASGVVRITRRRLVRVNAPPAQRTVAPRSSNAQTTTQEARP